MSDLVWSSRAGRIATANSVNLRVRFLLLRGPVDVIPVEAEELRTLVQHEMETEDAPQLDEFITKFPIAGTDEVTRVRYVPGKQRVEINDDQYFSDVPPDIWQFSIGGYQVCEKWLKDRRGRVLSNDDIQHWQRVVVALGETLRLMAEIDALIPEWPMQ